MTTCAEVIANSKAGFGTSGVRGLVEELDDTTCIAYVTAFLDHLNNNFGLTNDAPVWIGKDLRPSSEAIASACIKAIQLAGHHAIYCGEIPTPALAYSALDQSSPAIMVTGSHIPFDRNGIKFYRADGEISKQDEDPIKKSTAGFPQFIESISPKLSLETKAHDAWLQRYITAFDGLLTGMIIGHYHHSASGRDLLTRLLERLGATVVPVGRSEKFVPIDTEAVSDADEKQAKRWVQQHKFDALISTDGDGDRPLLADENGTYFRGDTLGMLAALALQADTVVTPVSSNSALEKSGLFTQTIRTKIGSPHVIDAMENASRNDQARVVGFEANGGFLTASLLTSPWNNETLKPLPTRDSVLPVLATIALSKKRTLPLSQLSGLLPARFTASDRLENVQSERSMDLIAKLRSDTGLADQLHVNGTRITEINEIDGHRMIFANHDIIHLRPSGNAPELRVYVESNDQQFSIDLLHFAKSKTAELLGQMS